MWNSEIPQSEHLQSEELRKALESYEVFETQNELNHRIEILAKLNTLAKEWIKKVALARNMPEESAQKLGGKIYTFGSYRMDVHDKSADIDAVCVAPRNITHCDYFTTFFKIIKERPEVTKCRAIEDAYVPVIKMNFDGIDIDLLFASLSRLAAIPDDLNLRAGNLLENLGQRAERSLNGVRLTEEILSLVPNKDDFRLALRSIKLWAKKRKIYSNSLGFFGGVAWALLVARTCQLYPNATASTLIHKFFLVFSRWQWSQPVFLKPLNNANLEMHSGKNLMPIITPVNPQNNCTFKVSASAKKLILMELDRGMATTDEIMLGRASWHRLFEATNFFNRYENFIVLLVSSQTADDHLKWCGLTESKVCHLVGNLEQHRRISLAHVNPKCFDYKKGCNNNMSTGTTTIAASGGQTAITDSHYCSMWFIGLEFVVTKNPNVELNMWIEDFKGSVRMRARKINMFKYTMSIEGRQIKRNQLSQYLDDDFLKEEPKVLDSPNSSANTKETMKRKIEQDDDSTTAKRCGVE